MKKRALWLLAGLILSCASTTAQQRFRFKGEFVSDGPLGISVAGDAEKQLIAVVSQRYRYGMVLPYAEDWEFFREGSALLRGHSGKVNLTLQAFTCDEGPEAHLADKCRFPRSFTARSSRHLTVPDVSVSRFGHSGGRS